jgi:hypothetical protein
VLLAAFRVARELGKDVDDVLQYSSLRLNQWITFLNLKAEDFKPKPTASNVDEDIRSFFRARREANQTA